MEDLKRLTTAKRRSCPIQSVTGDLKVPAIANAERLVNKNVNRPITRDVERSAAKDVKKPAIEDVERPTTRDTKKLKS